MAVLILLFLCLGLFNGCGNGSKEGEGPSLDQLSETLYGINKELFDISLLLLEEDSTKSQYLDQEDKQSLERLSDSLEEVEKEIESLKGLESEDSRFKSIIIEKEILRIVANTIYTYILLRDAGLKSKYIFMIIPQNNQNYSLESNGWIEVLKGEKENPFNSRELTAWLLWRYLESAIRYNYFYYYGIDYGHDDANNLLDLNKDKLQVLFSYYSQNLQRIKEEVSELEVADELVPIKTEILDLVELMGKQNEILSNMNWPIEDKNAVEGMYEEYDAHLEYIREQIESTGLIRT